MAEPSSVERLTNLNVKLRRADEDIEKALELFVSAYIHGMSTYTRAMVTNKLCDIAGELRKVRLLIGGDPLPELDGEALAQRAFSARDES